MEILCNDAQRQSRKHSKKDPLQKAWAAFRADPVCIVEPGLTQYRSKILIKQANDTLLEFIGFSIF